MCYEPIANGRCYPVSTEAEVLHTGGFKSGWKPTLFEKIQAKGLGQHDELKKINWKWKGLDHIAVPRLTIGEEHPQNLCWYIGYTGSGEQLHIDTPPYSAL